MGIVFTDASQQADTALPDPQSAAAYMRFPPGTSTWDLPCAESKIVTVKVPSDDEGGIHNIPGGEGSLDKLTWLELVGSRKVKLLPLPSTLSAQIRPPWISTMTLETDKPEPHPTVCAGEMRFHLVKTFENVGQIFGWDADPVVNDRDLNIAGN